MPDTQQCEYFRQGPSCVEDALFREKWPGIEKCFQHIWKMAHCHWGISTPISPILGILDYMSCAELACTWCASAPRSSKFHNLASRRDMAWALNVNMSAYTRSMSDLWMFVSTKDESTIHGLPFAHAIWHDILSLDSKYFTQITWMPEICTSIHWRQYLVCWIIHWYS